MRELMDRIGYTFKNERLLQTALTHSSYVNESKNTAESYERLEFLGDSILSFVISSHLYNNFRQLPEGALSKMRASLVCERSLAKCAGELGLGENILFSKGEANTGGRARPSILADVFEAIIAAIYLDGGIDRAVEFILCSLEDGIKQVESGKNAFDDYKTLLQEEIQKEDNRYAEYRHVREDGPEHSKVFTVELLVNGEKISDGTGRSKKDAEQDAANKALKMLKG